jgi:hypothetical protein
MTAGRAVRVAQTLFEVLGPSVGKGQFAGRIYRRVSVLIRQWYCAALGTGRVIAGS